MSREPTISVIIVSNRPYWWKEIYDNVMRYDNDVKLEMVFVSPYDPEISLGRNSKHIKTENIKVPQSFEIGIRESQGDMLLFIADDAKYKIGGVHDIYRRHLHLCEELGHDNIVVVPGLKVGTSVSNLRYNKKFDAPIASLNSALIDRKLLSRIGSIDTRFVGVYWDCDLSMRLHEIGVHFEKYDGTYVVEGNYKRIKNPYLLHRICKPHDRLVLDSFWTRYSKEIEDPLPDDAYCYLKNKNWVVVKKRREKVVPFHGENILVNSQGVKEFGGLKWD